VKSDATVHCRKTLHSNTESRVEEWENEIWKNHTDAATLHLNVFSLAFDSFQARVIRLL
jgi:hypothetical protein